MRTGVFVFALAAMAACSGQSSAPERTAFTSLPIQGGMPDTADSFVVAVVEQEPQAGGVGLCSGSLLAPNLVATARHCVAPASPQPIVCAQSAFGATVSPSSLQVTNDSSITDPAAQWHAVQQIIVPSAAGQTTFCGDDLALLILAEPISVPKYVTPVINPPMTDRSAYSTTITAIGYGVDTPTDTMGMSAGVRRIREDIDLSCIPNDPGILNCLSDPSLTGYITPNEFEASDGTCDGDSGSGAFEQRNFDAGSLVSFGVLSRGTTDADGSTCVGPIYTRFDVWGSLVIQTAVEAAQLGGYATPTWAITPAPAADASNGTDGAASSSACLPNALACGADNDCCSNNCISHDDITFLCSSCNNTNDVCATGYVCAQGTCVASVDSGAGPEEGVTKAPASSPASSGGCTAAGPSRRAAGSELLGAALLWLFLGYRRRGALQRQCSLPTPRAKLD
jgi:hypothetical protein